MGNVATNPVSAITRMVNPALAMVLLFGATQIAKGQQTIKIDNASKVYDLTVETGQCVSDHAYRNVCPSARVSLFKKGEKAPFQILNLPTIDIYQCALTYNAEKDSKPRELYDDDYSVFFGDYNFDGYEDLAICNGRNGGYGGPSYTVFLYDPKSNRMVESKRLSKLTEEIYLGFFSVDSQKKRLQAFWKSGCCFHETQTFRVVNNNPVMVEKVSEELSDDQRYWIATTSRRVGGKWVKHVKRTRADLQQEENLNQRFEGS